MMRGNVGFSGLLKSIRSDEVHLVVRSDLLKGCLQSFDGLVESAKRDFDERGLVDFGLSFIW